MDKRGTVFLADAIHDSLVSEKDGTSRDVHDMHRMGKKQLLRRNFGFFSIFSFTVVLLSTWEVVLGTAAFGLDNGGTAGLIYMYILSFAGYIFVIVSMAEMASMAPTAGGQYHWVSEFAPPSAQRFLSYTMGWLSVMAWQCGTAAGCFLAATELQGIIVLNYPDYNFQYWHGTLISTLIAILLVVLNTVGVRLLPYLETYAFVLHMTGFFAFVIPVWSMGAKPSPSLDVFTQFTNQGGWQSMGLSVLIGIITPITALIGSDSAVHLTEELRNASKSLPRAMMATIALNGGLGFVTVLTFCYNIGDIASVLDTPTGFPFIQLYYNITGSIKGTTAMVSIMIILSIANATANMATASRQLFAFARDQGVPFQRFFAHVPDQGRIRETPLNSILFTGVVSSLLSVINVGSNIAYNQLASMGIAALLSSYLVSTSCMALRRARGQPLLPAHFRLGRAGLPVNLVAIGFLLLAFVMSFFPPVAHPAPDTMNWAIMVYGVVIVASLAYYIPVGRHHYKGPVAQHLLTGFGLEVVQVLQHDPEQAPRPPPLVRCLLLFKQVVEPELRRLGRLEPTQNAPARERGVHVLADAAVRLGPQPRRDAPEMVLPQGDGRGPGLRGHVDGDHVLHQRLVLGGLVPRPAYIAVALGLGAGSAGSPLEARPQESLVVMPKCRLDGLGGYESRGFLGGQIQGGD